MVSFLSRRHRLEGCVLILLCGPFQFRPVGGRGWVTTRILFQCVFCRDYKDQFIFWSLEIRKERCWFCSSPVLDCRLFAQMPKIWKERMLSWCARGWGCTRFSWKAPPSVGSYFILVTDEVLTELLKASYLRFSIPVIIPPPPPNTHTFFFTSSPAQPKSIWL